MSDDAMQDSPAETPTDKLSHEVADAEFERMAELWDLDTDTDTMTEEDEDSFNQQKRPLIRGLQKGYITVDDEGIVTVAMRFSSNGLAPESVKLDPSKANALAMDKFKQKEAMHKVAAYTASLGGVPIKVFNAIDDRDKKPIRALVNLFLGS